MHERRNAERGHGQIKKRVTTRMNGVELYSSNVGRFILLGFLNFVRSKKNGVTFV